MSDKPDESHLQQYLREQLEKDMKVLYAAFKPDAAPTTEPEEAPVGVVSDLFPSVRRACNERGIPDDAPLYTSPGFKPLTAEEVWASDTLMALNAELLGLPMHDLMKVVRAVESAQNLAWR